MINPSIEREALLTAIGAAVLPALDTAINTDRIAALALEAIEKVGYVVVPRAPTSDMILRVGLEMGQGRRIKPGAGIGDLFLGAWRGLIEASPLYFKPFEWK